MAHYLRHFQGLTSHDRYLRFGGYISPEGIERYLGSIPSTDGMVEVWRDGVLAGLAHIAVSGEEAEVGLSVLPEYRRQGIGGELLARTVEWCRERGIGVLSTQCLATNSWMIARARKSGMSITIAGSERYGKLKISA